LTGFSSNMSTIYLVRHGESYASKTPGILGTDMDLTNSGVLHAKDLANWLKDSEIDLILTSNLKRAINTARVIHHFHKDKKLVLDKSLNEKGYGDFENMPVPDFYKNHSKLAKQKKRDPFYFRHPGGENYEDLINRVKPIIDKITSNVLIVGHQHVNRAILGIILNLEKITNITMEHDAIHKIENKKCYKSIKGSKFKICSFIG